MAIKDIFEKLIKFEEEHLNDAIVASLLFGAGELGDSNKTDFFVTNFLERYKLSIKTVNFAFALNVGFAVIALVAFLSTPSGKNVKMPFLGIDLTRELWVSLSPAISFVLQLYVFVALLWLMLLRRYMDFLKRNTDWDTHFGDIRNMLLTGTAGVFWILFRLHREFNSRLNYMWTVPMLASLVALFCGPLFLCGYFIAVLFQQGQILLFSVYALMLVSSTLLLLTLILVNIVLSDIEIKRENLDSRADAANIIVEIIEEFNFRLQRYLVGLTTILLRDDPLNYEDLVKSKLSVEMFSYCSVVVNSLSDEVKWLNSPLNSLLARLRGQKIRVIHDNLLQITVEMDDILNKTVELDRQVSILSEEKQWSQENRATTKRVVGEISRQLNRTVRAGIAVALSL